MRADQGSIRASLRNHKKEKVNNMKDEQKHLASAAQKLVEFYKNLTSEEKELAHGVGFHMKTKDEVPGEPFAVIFIKVTDHTQANPCFGYNESQLPINSGILPDHVPEAA